MHHRDPLRSLALQPPLVKEAVSLNTFNRLFDRLSPSDRALLRPHLEHVSLPSETYLYKAESLPEFAHFLTSGLAHIFISMRNSKTSEIDVCGNEGVVESFHLLGDSPIATDAVMQIEGSAIRMPFTHLRSAFDSSDSLRCTILEHVQRQSSVRSQISACNRLHGSTERLARLLLVIQDRSRDSRIKLTQEFLSEMLGSRRSTVTVSAGILQDAGMIEYRRGSIQIVDRAKLECASCECYGYQLRLLDGGQQLTTRDS